MKTNVYELLKSRNIKIENDNLIEVLKYVNVDSEISDEDLLDEITIDNLDYSGAVHEVVDGSVDVYYNQLDKWIGEGNGHYVSQAISDGLCDGNDFYQSVMCGQYVAYMEEFTEALEDLRKELGE